MLKLILRNTKWLVEAIYTPLSQCKYYFITELKIRDKYRGSYENTVILGNFNMQPRNQYWNFFWKIITLLIKSSLIHGLSENQEVVLI